MCARKPGWLVAINVFIIVCCYSCLGQDVQRAQQMRQTAAPNLRLSNTSTKIDKKQYKWTLYIDADKSVLDRISYVEYLLHPAFDAPDRKVDSPRTGPHAFAVSDVAFRPAEITTVIHFRDGSKQYIDYTLRLRSSFNNTWYVVVGYFGGNQWDQAQSLAKAYQQKGFKAAAVDTNSGDFPNFDRGVVMVVIGPSTETQARSLMRKVPTLGGKLYVQQAAKA